MFEAFHTFRSCLLLFRTKPSALQKKPYGSLKRSGANIPLETFTNDGVIFLNFEVYPEAIAEGE